MPKVPHKSSRTECITMRVSSKLRYGLELLCRIHFRNLTETLDFALNEAIKAEGIPLNDLWSFDPKERIKKLQEHSPHLVTYDEKERGA